MESREIRALLCRLNSPERKMSDEDAAAHLAATFPVKTYETYLAELKAGRAAREAAKARIREEHPDWLERQVLEDLKPVKGPWYEGDEYWEYRMGWSGAGKETRL